MASFRKRGPYQWRAYGQPLQTKTFETRALAEQWARAIEVEMDKGVFFSRAEAIKPAYIRAVRRAGIENLRSHDLRHEATTRLLEKGLNTMEVARWKSPASQVTRTCVCCAGIRI